MYKIHVKMWFFINNIIMYKEEKRKKRGLLRKLQPTDQINFGIIVILVISFGIITGEETVK
jgi:hypothetical protein